MSMGTESRITLAWVLVWATVLAAIAWFIWGDTVGRQFRSAMKDREAYCRKEKLGPFLDKTDSDYKQKQAQTDCDALLFKPIDPLDTDEGRYAHSLKLPPPHDQSKDLYRWWMTGESYFKTLCEAEAGEWVFKVVDNVESVVQLRSFPKYSAGGLGPLLVAEDIYESQFQVGGTGLLESLPRYEFMEIPEKRSRPDTPASTFIRYRSTTNTDAPNAYVDRRFGASEVARYPTPHSRYGFTQRGIRRTGDLEHGIRGAEFLIVDRNANEVLGLVRRFLRYTIAPPFKGTLTAHACPNERQNTQFVKSVLRPKQFSKEGS